MISLEDPNNGFYEVYRENSKTIELKIFVGKCDKLILPSSVNGKAVECVYFDELGTTPIIINELFVPDGIAIGVKSDGAFIKHIVFEGELRFTDPFFGKPVFYGLETLDYNSCSYDVIDGVFYSKPDKKMNRSLIFYPFYRKNALYIMPEDVKECETPICNKWVEHIVISKKVTNSSVLIQSCDKLKSLFIFKSFDKYSEGGAYSRIDYSLSNLAAQVGIESEHPSEIKVFYEGTKEKLVWWRWINSVTPSALNIKLKWKHLEFKKKVIADQIRNPNSHFNEELEFSDYIVKCSVAHADSDFGYGSFTSCRPSSYYHNCSSFGDFLDNVRTIEIGDCIKELSTDEYKKYDAIRSQLYLEHSVLKEKERPSIILHVCSPWPNYEINYISCKLFEIKKGGYLDYLAFLRFKGLTEDDTVDLFFTDAFSPSPTGVAVSLVEITEIKDFKIEEYDPEKRSLD